MSEENSHLKLTVIIPVYNQQSTVARCLDSLLRGWGAFFFLEILVIDDGSTDSSAEICQKYAARHAEIQYFFQQNRGVSAARNLGLRKASGKYIFFVDADDALQKGTLKRVAQFFESVYDEVDLVTYPIETIYQGKKLNPHFRYLYLKETGVYDLRKYPYIGQTTMNIVVKNKFKDNILFDEQQNFSEDQKYCCEVLREKLKMGFCSQGTYFYYRNKSSASSRLNGSCYIFEQCTAFFEQLFAYYEEGAVPLAFQGLFVNDMYWKLVSNILFPYHYDKDSFYVAKRRLGDLLARCENHVILEHPEMDFFEKYYLLRYKGRNTLQYSVTNGSYSLLDGKKLILQETSMELVMTRVFIKGSMVRLEGFLKSVFFQFYDQKPTLCVVENDGELAKSPTLFASAHNYYLSHEPTQRFWAFTYSCHSEEVRRITFRVEVGGHWFPVHFYFMPLVPFSHHYQSYTYQKDRVRLKIHKRNQIHLTSIAAMDNRRIWLYYDCSGVPYDNGMLQFQHDRAKRDGIERYYIITDSRQMQRLKDQREDILFGSRRHRELFLKAEKIITAYIELNNIIPFPESDYDKISSQIRFEVIYLQHGVLHIVMPWKYTPEKILADRVVVSTKREAALFVKNGFREETLWKYRMPRFSERKQEITMQKHKILFAPSWRSYLVGADSGRTWERMEDIFLHSEYYKKFQDFLNHRKLLELLETYDFHLEVKLHPVFEGYKKHFFSASERIRVVDTVGEPGIYALFITDFSSFLFDFLFQRVPVLMFIPDRMEFHAGMNGYSRLDQEDELQIVSETDEIVEQIGRFLENGSYWSRKEVFFEENCGMEQIYGAMLEEE